MSGATPKGFLAGLLLVGVDDRFVPRARTFLFLAFALVVLAGAAAVTLVLRADAADALVSHTLEVRQAASDLLSDMQDAETGQRGFLLTGDVRYLGPFERADSTVATAFDNLRRLSSDDPGLGQRLNALRPVVDAKFDELRGTVALARAGRGDEALALVRSNRGRALMGDIRARLAAVSRDQLGLLASREADAKALRSWTLGLIALSLIAALGLAAVLARATQVYVDQLRAAKAALEAEAKLRHDAEDTLRQVHKIEAVGQLTGGIAHDFNNMLTVIMGGIDRVQRRLAEAPPTLLVSELRQSAARQLDLALQGCRSAAQLTYRLLAFSRRQPLRPERVDLNRLITGMSDMLHRSLGETVHVETVLAAGLWPTFVDANQLENALLNLAVNARDAMPDGGKLTIESANTYLDDAYVRRFGDFAAGQYVVLGVTDSGGGIAAEVLGRVFEPFFTTKGEGAGTGLGLAMVHGFVKQSGGHVRIYSEVGDGTTVKLYLPRLMQPEPAVATPPAKSADLSAPHLARPLETILLVEDNDGVREYAKAILEELGYDVLDAGDAKAALRLLDRASRVDLLFTDVMLPGGVTGRELSRLVLERRAGLPVLFTTGYTRNAIVHQGRLDPDVHLLNKPFTQQELARKLRELLDT